MGNYPSAKRLRKVGYLQRSKKARVRFMWGVRVLNSAWERSGTFVVRFSMEHWNLMQHLGGIEEDRPQGKLRGK